MNIRHAVQDDLPEILRVYEAARQIMRDADNPTQWGDTWPPEDVVQNDIEKRISYVVEDDTGIHGIFVLLFGDDPMYEVIEHGSWPNNRPYVTIHRLASDGLIRGIFQASVDFARQEAERAGLRDIRIDTHADNTIMLHCIEKAGFGHCGTVYHIDDTPRTAFQLSW